MEVSLVKLEVKNLLQNPACATVLGGIKNANNLLGRAQVLNANTVNPSYRGTGGVFSRVAGEAYSRALNPSSTNLAYSESGNGSVGRRTIYAQNIYLNDRFFTNIGPSQQDTVFIHELNRLNGYGKDDQPDYARITKACGTANPYGPSQ